MSLDGIAMRALAHSLEDTINGGRIDKISQPNATSITMKSALTEKPINSMLPLTLKVLVFPLLINNLTVR